MNHEQTPLVTSVTDVIDDCAELSDRAVLDIGCGRGGVVRHLAARGARACGLETRLELVRGARSRERVSDESYLVGLGQQLPFADRAFDLVLFCFSLHHVPAERMRAALAEAARVVTDEGVVLVVEPVADGDYFEVMRLVDDETRVRALALQALRDRAAHGLATEPDQVYRVHHRFRDAEHMFESLVTVDPARAPIIDRHRDELCERFARHGKPDAGGFRFEMEMRGNLLRKTAAA